MSDQDLGASTVDSAAELFPAVGQKRRRGVRVTTAAVVALGLAVGGGAIAGAASTSTSSPSTSVPGQQTYGPTDHGNPPAGGTPPAAVGIVKTVGSDIFTITARDGTTVTVNVSGATTYQDQGVTSPNFANVTVGEHVAVFGTDTSNTVTATKVAIGNPPNDGRDGPGGPGGPVGGTPPAWSGTNTG